MTAKTEFVREKVTEAAGSSFIPSQSSLRIDRALKLETERPEYGEAMRLILTGLTL
jgi:hypothetical protein